MLCVDQQPVVAAVGHLFGNRWTVRVQKYAQLGATFAQLLLKLCSTERLDHLLSPHCVFRIWDTHRPVGVFYRIEHFYAMGFSTNANGPNSTSEV